MDDIDAKAKIIALRLSKQQPWEPKDATDNIRELARGNCAIHYKFHSRDQMLSRDLSTVDVMHVLKNGFVYDEPEESTRPDLFKYRMECVTPNSHPRFVRLVVIPCATTESIKILTCMWRDE